jgi:hypothetical protein
MMCPECKRRLKADAAVCLCGWGSRASRHSDCFFAPQCTKHAQIYTDRYAKKGDFMNLCFACDERLHHEKSDKWCREHGLITTQQKIDFCRSMAKKMWPGVKFIPSRVPGEDDELAA